MSSQEINYTHGSDTGERDSAAVAPINPGEKVKAAIFDRPIDNLRNRSEVLRDEVIDQKYLQDTDIMWLIAEGAAVTGLNPPASSLDLPMILWNPDSGVPGTWEGRFSIGPLPGASMVIQPIKTPRQDTVTSGGEDMVYTFVTDTVTITSFFRNYAGGNRREVRWVWDAGITGTALAFLSGSPNHILTIHVASDGTTQVTDVDNALLALGASLGAAGFSHGVTGGGDLIAVVPTDHIFTKIHEREMHRIPWSQFDAFFGPPTSFLADGDTLAIYYEWMVEPVTNPPPATGGRRQACPTNGNIDLTAGQLFITTQEPEKIPIGIPICKRIGNDLIFLDGTVCYGSVSMSGTPLYAGEHGYTVNRVFTASSWVEANITSQWYGSLPLSGGPPWTIDGALNNIIGDLATVGLPSGAQRVGMAPTAAPNTSLGFYNVPVGGDSVGSALLALVTLLNTKASLGLGAAFDAEETITGRWKFNNHVRIGQEKVILRDVPSNNQWKLCYRNYRIAGQTEVNSQVTPETYSVYESANDAGDYGQVLEVFGAYSANPDEVVSAAAGAGKVLVIKKSNRQDTDGSYLIAHRINCGPSVTLNIYNPAHWDYYQHLSQNAGVMTNHVYGQDGTGGRPLTKQHWHIPQVVDSDIDFGGFVPGDLFGQYSRIQVGSTPWSYVMEGLYAMPENPLLTFVWSADELRVSCGRALVDGRPIVYSGPTGLRITSLSTKLMGDPGVITLPTSADDGNPAKIPQWYYLWLRKDRQFFIGERFPRSDWDGYAPGVALYRPDPAEVHTGFTQADYVLLDVVCLLQVYNDAGTDKYYWDVAPDVGGGERRLLTRVLPSTFATVPTRLSREVMRNIGTVPPGVVFPYSLVQNGTGDAPPAPERRTPGVPHGVSKTAVLTVGLVLRSANGDLASFTMYYNYDWRFEPSILNPLAPPLFLAPEVSFQRALVSPGGPLSVQMGWSDRVEIVPYLNMVNAGVVVSGVDAYVEVYVHQQGFKWNRREGIQSGS